MKTLLLLFLVSCASTTQVQTKTVSEPNCQVILIYPPNVLPTCSFELIALVQVSSTNQRKLIESARSEVCRRNGHFFLTTRNYVSEKGYTLKGWIARCNVPFLLPSDFSPR